MSHVTSTSSTIVSHTNGVHAPKTPATLRWYSMVPTQEVMFWVLWIVAGSESAKTPDLLVCLRWCLVFNWACMCWSHINHSHNTDWTSNTTCSNHLHFNSTKHGSQQSKLCPLSCWPWAGWGDITMLHASRSPPQAVLASRGYWKCGATLCTYWLLATMKHKRRLLKYALTLFWREKNYIKFFTTIKFKSVAIKSARVTFDPN